MLLIFSLGIILSGAVAATDGNNDDNQADINITVSDENYDPADVVCNNTKITTEISASTSEYIKDPYTVVNVDPSFCIDYDPYHTQMWDGNSWITNNPNSDPFFYKYDGNWIWNMGFEMSPGDEFMLIAPGTVEYCGPIEVTGDFYGTPKGENNPAVTADSSPGYLLASNSYRFFSECEDPSVDVTVVDENDDPVDEACTDEEIFTEVCASAGFDYVKHPKVLLTVEPEGILEFVPEETQMWDGSNWKTNDPNSSPFFYKENGKWIWDIRCEMCPHDVFMLLAPTKMNDCGDINVTADFYGFASKTDNMGILSSSQEVNSLLDSDSFTFKAVYCDDGDDGNAAGEPETNENENTAGQTTVSAANETVPMQTTGAPLFLTILALFAILGGIFFGKFRQG